MKKFNLAGCIFWLAFIGYIGLHTNWFKWDFDLVENFIFVFFIFPIVFTVLILQIVSLVKKNEKFSKIALGFSLLGIVALFIIHTQLRSERFPLWYTNLHKDSYTYSKPFEQGTLSYHLEIVNPDSWAQKISLIIDNNKNKNVHVLKELNADNFNALNLEEPIVLLDTDDLNKYVFQISDIFTSYYYVYNLGDTTLEYLASANHGSWNCRNLEDLNIASCHSTAKIKSLQMNSGRSFGLATKNSVNNDKTVSEKFYLAVRYSDKDVYDFLEFPGNPKSIYNVKVNSNDSLKMISQTENEIIFETINRIEKHKYKFDLITMTIIQLD